MARKKSESQTSTPDTAVDFAKDEPLHRPKDEAPAKTKTIDMVRAAIAAGHATAKVGIPWIKKTFDVDIKAGNFSVNKSTIERRDAEAANSAPAPKRTYTPRKPKEEPSVVVIAATVAPTANGHMSPSEAARSVKDLIDRLGVKEVKSLVELFGG
jgi:hypothetical protein